ncbi:MFS transporter [Paenibacillus polymyxa]|uniref:MFS transporter n=1 Tax=Paenibacillus polymyxa TaxID=1406 RepID=UPI002ED2C4BF
MLRTNASFRKFWCVEIFSTLAFQMLAVTIGWQMYALTHDAFKLGLVGLAEFAPMVLLTLIGGQVADRFNRPKIILVCQLTECVVILFLAISSIGDWIQSYHILVAAVLFGSARAFENPASSAMIPSLVNRAGLPEAAAWHSSAGQTASILGPALGGILIVFAPSVVYVTSLIAVLFSASLISRIKVIHTYQNEETANVESLLTGLLFVFKRKIILGTISLDLFAVLLGGATALLPIFSKDVLQTGSWGLGLMRTAPAIGALLMSLLLTRFSIQHSVGKYLFSSLAVFGISTIVFGISNNLVLSLTALFFIGASDVVSVVIRSTIVQLNTPLEMQGRVGAINSLFIGTSNQLGEFESGMMAGWFGAVRATVIGGAGSIAIAILWMYLFPSLRTMKTYYAEESKKTE